MARKPLFVSNLPSHDHERRAAGGAIRPREHDAWLVCLFLLIAVAFVYWDVQSFCFLNFDDRLYLVDNPYIAEGVTADGVRWALASGLLSDSPYSDYWQPLTFLSRMLDMEFFAYNPSGHHVVNVLFHMTNTVLLFLLFRRLSGHAWPSAFVAVLFGIHPLHVESVAWITERKDVLSTFFLLLALWAYHFYVCRPGVARYIPVVLFHGMGLASKPMFVTFPFMLLLLDAWPYGARWSGEDGRGAGTGCDPRPPVEAGRRNVSWRSLWIEKIPFMVLSVLSCLVTFTAQWRWGIVQDLDRFPIGVRLANAVQSYLFYLEKMFVPLDLAAYYPHAGAQTDPRRLLAAVLLLTGVSLLAAFMRHTQPYLLFGWLWFLGALVPVIGVVQTARVARADRFVYVPMLGVYVMLAWGLRDLAGKRPRWKMVLLTAPCICIGVLAHVARQQVGYWRNDFTLFAHALSVTTDNDIAHLNLGSVFLARGDQKKALEHYLKALRSNPANGAAHDNLGVIYGNLNDPGKAMYHFQESLRHRPDDLTTLNNFGVFLQKTGRLEEASEKYLKILSIDSRDKRAHNNLAHVLMVRGMYLQAIDHYYIALQLDPDYFTARRNLAKALKFLNRLDEASLHFRKALALRPDDPESHLQFADVLAQQKNYRDARIHLQRYCALRPEDKMGYVNLGKVLVRMGLFEDAMQTTRRALAIDPDCVEAHTSLGVICFRTGDLPQAALHYEKSLRLQPDVARNHNDLGVVYYYLGDYARAVAHLSRACGLQPDYQSAGENLAKARHALEADRNTPAPSTRTGGRNNAHRQIP